MKRLISAKFLIFEIFVTLFSSFIVIFLSGRSKLLIFGISGYELYFVTIITFVLLGFFVRILNPNDHYLLVKLIIFVRLIYFVVVNFFVLYIFFTVLDSVNAVLLDISGVINLTKTHWGYYELSFVFDEIVEAWGISGFFSEINKDDIILSSNNPDELQDAIREAYKKKYEILEKQRLVNLLGRGVLLVAGLCLFGGAIVFIFKLVR